MLPSTPNYEKQGTPIIDIEDLRALGQIIRPIKARVESAECSSYGPGISTGAVGSHAVVGKTGRENSQK